MTDAYIVGAVRSAGGKKNGRLSKVHPIDLGAEVVDALVARTGVPVDEIDDLIFGCVSQVRAMSVSHRYSGRVFPGPPLIVSAVQVSRRCTSRRRVCSLVPRIW